MKEKESLIKLINTRIIDNSNEIELLLKLNYDFTIYKHHCIKQQIEYLLIEEFLETINFRLFLNFLRGDIFSALNSLSKSETNYESTFSVRNIIVIINEGIKKIYNFEAINEQGNIKLKYRNNSFWIKNIKPIVLKNIEFDKQFNKITDNLDSFLENDFKKIKEFRDLSIHYDKNSIDVLNMLIALNYTEIEKLALDFLTVTTELVDITESLMEKLRSEIQIRYNRGQSTKSITFN